MCLAAMCWGSSGACLGNGQSRGLDLSSPSISVSSCHSRPLLAFRWLYALGYHTYSVDVTPPRPLELKASCVLRKCEVVQLEWLLLLLQDWESTILPLLHEGKAGELETKHGISAQGLAELMAVHDSAPVPALFGCSGPGGLSPV